MSLSSLGSFSASSAATLRAPDCSSALGMYVPSVCLFFLTTQKSQPRTARIMTKTPTVTVGATMAAMLGPVGSVELELFGMKVEFPHTGSVLSRSSKMLLTTTPGVAGTSGHVAAIAIAAAAAILARGLWGRVGGRLEGLQGIRV